MLLRGLCLVLQVRIDEHVLTMAEGLGRSLGELLGSYSKCRKTPLWQKPGVRGLNDG